jgi:polyhydroxybutyrate depolymerase
LFYRIEDGGHTWPGSSIVLTQPWSGKTSQDIVASQLIWQFFEAHPLP